MKPVDPNAMRSQANPLDMKPESVEEANLLRLLKVLVAAGKLSEDDVLAAWKLAFEA